MTDKVLIIEDEIKIARTVRLYLEQSNYQVALVTDGQQALAAFRHEAPDIVLLDLMLPKVDGWEICRQIRRESTVPIIMLTARSFEKAVADGIMSQEQANWMLERMNGMYTGNYGATGCPMGTGYQDGGTGFRGGVMGGGRWRQTAP